MPRYGVWQEKDLALDYVAGEVDRDTLLDAQRETIASHNQGLIQVASIFGDFITRPQAVVRQGTDGEHQPLDEFGRPMPTKPALPYIVGFPLWKAGSAQGYNFWTAEQMTVQEYADGLDLMLRSDTKWFRRQILSPMFYNGAGLPYSNVQTAETFTVYGLANNDAVTYDKVTGAAADDHYSGQTNPIGAGVDNPYPAIYDDLIEHPDNAGRIVAFISPSLVTTTRALAQFAPAIQDMIRLVPGSATADIEPVQAPALGLPLPSSMHYEGMHENTYIVSWTGMPAGYMLTVAVDNPVKPVGIREYAQPSLRGLINQGEPMARFPYTQSNYVRAMGCGARNRIAAHVHRVGGTYAAPTGFGFPNN